MIRFLTADEKQDTREFYEMSFPEDSKEIVDYYYQYRVPENEIYVWEEDGEHQVMIHMNPFMARTKKGSFPITFLVAIATKPEYRRQGKMGQMLGWAMEYLERKGQPFVFLMPANDAYYKSSGFQFLPEMDMMVVDGMSLSAAEFSLDEMSAYKLETYECKWAAEFSNQILAHQYDLFLERNEAYYQRILAEVACQGGDVLVIKESQSTPFALLSYVKKDGSIEVQEVVSKEKLSLVQLEFLFPGQKVRIANMPYMAHILNQEKYAQMNEELFEDTKILIREWV